MTQVKGRSGYDFVAGSTSNQVLLETRSSKEDILELYLNDVYLGQRGSFGIHGVEQASQIYFGKNSGNLTVAQAAMLAAIIRSPNASSPFRYPEETRNRRDVVLTQMRTAGFLTEDEARRGYKELSDFPGYAAVGLIIIGEIRLRSG